MISTTSYGRLLKPRAAASRLCVPFRLKVTGLSPTHALAYVSGLLTGEVPAQLLGVAQRELVKPVDRVLAVRTYGVDADF
ncbi:hypothetical protein [Streptomyces sp. NPDC008122]|uniref:hypothetical protein n=1 Tax=Streptomyces sp. NPDC008122 TaxID=3364810 RepID=UPI0036E74D90